MVDSGQQARRFEEFWKKYWDDGSERWRHGFYSFLEFQKKLSVDYEQMLAEERKAFDSDATSNFTKLMMTVWLDTVKFEREQMATFLDTQACWNDKYREFLDSLENDIASSRPDAPKPDAAK